MNRLSMYCVNNIGNVNLRYCQSIIIVHLSYGLAAKWAPNTLLEYAVQNIYSAMPQEDHCKITECIPTIVSDWPDTCIYYHRSHGAP